MCLLDQSIALFFFGSVAYQCHTGIVDTHDTFHIDRTHLGELDQMRSSCINIGSTVDKQCHSICCRKQRS